jgi:hypothetical protein
VNDRLKAALDISKIPKKQTRSERVLTTWTPEELKRLKEIAEQRGTPVASVVHDIVVAVLEGKGAEMYAQSSGTNE